MGGTLFVASCLVLTSVVSAMIDQKTCSECPAVPDRNFLGQFHLTQENSTFVHLDMRPCKPRGAQEEEPEVLLYALRTIEIDGLKFTGRIYDIAFAHKICAPSCELLVYLNQKETRSLDTDWQESQIAMDCDYQMTNCTVLSWKCNKWVQEENEELIMKKLKEAMTPEEQ